VAVADDEPAEGRQRRFLAIGLLLLRLAELPRRTAVGAPLEVGVEQRRLEVADVQRRAVPGAPEVAVAELELRIAREDRVRRRAPRRRADLDRCRAHSHAAEQADANARGALHVAADDDAAIEHGFEAMLNRADEERPADRLAQKDRDDERGDERDQRQWPAHAGTPRGERTSHGSIVEGGVRRDLSARAGVACGPAPTVGARFGVEGDDAAADQDRCRHGGVDSMELDRFSRGTARIARPARVR
jgi:hypothetical protein